MPEPDSVRPDIELAENQWVALEVDKIVLLREHMLWVALELESFVCCLGHQIQNVFTSICSDDAQEPAAGSEITLL